MDPVTVGAVLLAVATGVSEALGGQLWAGLASLVRRPPHGQREPAGEPSPVLSGEPMLPGEPVPSGEAELAALRGAPGDQAKAVALAEALLARATADPGFDRALREWWERAAPVREKAGSVTNTISGGTQHGPVLQGRDFTGLTFGAAPPAPASRPGDHGTS